MIFGDQIKTAHTDERGYRSIVAEPESSPAGNVILTVGRKESWGWHKTEHVVLTPSEALEYANLIIAEAMPGA